VERPSLLTAGAVVFLLLGGCAARETPEQRVNRIRQEYRIQPNGYQPRVAADGTPELTVSVLVVGEGRDSVPWLTLRVHVQDADGRDRASALMTLDTSKLVPGVMSQLTGVVRGLEVGSGEGVLVELEDEPPPPERSAYPEYGATSAGGA
jgi:hypothetical protein